jgi:hypothetical protein
MIHQRANRPESLSVTVLSCDPKGAYARARGALENAIDPDYIAQDVAISQRTLQQLAGAAGDGFRWEWLVHEAMPQAWFLLTETEAFVELYHFGLGRREPGDPNSCIGGRVPILHATAGGGLYQALSEYFDYLVTPGVPGPRETYRVNYFKVRHVLGSSPPRA